MKQHVTARPIVRLAGMIAACLGASFTFAATPQPSPPVSAPSAPASPGAPGGAKGTGGPANTTDPATSVPSLEPLALPDWVILDPEGGANTRPWILIVDDPQCPYCMQLHLALAKAKEQNDPEISRAVVATLPYPLTYHDQSAHIVSDAFCLEATRKTHAWSAASYLNWLIVAPWRAEKEWASVTMDDLEKDNGFFDSKYDAHKVMSSRRREFQTEQARAESVCLPETCRGEEDCAKLCATLAGCRTGCQSPAAGTPAASPGAAAGAAPADRDACVKGCVDRFVSARYRQYSKVHSACLLEEGPASAHGKTAAAYAWATEHKVPGTPTVYVGHPSVGFRTLGDSDHLSDFLVLLRQGLAQTREKMSAAPPPR